ncbi:hypothetical protein GCM10011346_28700 [Oceanobacillus neutriphilus]|uniref:Uncharacterized protein n=1 Tax=Oceanobacillus neutriphilus TaxID=531815 RepID=A0ABQ2NWV0_9BACI|nr:hypothetical protein GCM10011346_28700 [Oceanobacillus neutriphilus]
MIITVFMTSPPIAYKIVNCVFVGISHFQMHQNKGNFIIQIIKLYTININSHQPECQGTPDI